MRLLARLEMEEALYCIAVMAAGVGFSNLVQSAIGFPPVQAAQVSFDTMDSPPNLGVLGT